MGFAKAEYRDKPFVAILNTWSEINSCHTHFRERAADIKRGVWQAGGVPVEMPAMTLAEAFERPSPMMHRNLASMQVEQVLRHYPFDGAVLMTGCDKTTPALLLGAISMNVPTIVVPAGPMLRGNWEGKVLGSGSDAWKHWEELRAGTITRDDLRGIEAGIARSPGLCMTMGTGMTMTALVETLGLALSGSSSIPAVDAAHPRMCAAAGRRIVELVWDDVRPRELLTPESFENASLALAAMGGSTNAIVHLVALARRAGVPFDIDAIASAAERMPVIVNLRPGGEFLGEDWYYAGGLRATLAQFKEQLNLGCMTVDGCTLGENIADARVANPDVIRPPANPVFGRGGLVVLRGNLAPDGAVMKTSACEARLLQHTGPALVFDSCSELRRAVEDDDLDVTADHVLVLRNAGPKGGPGMPEWGMLPLPAKLLKQGVRDMVRISDARMSGTSYGACVLHVSPEAWVGGPLALIQNGDEVRLDVAGRRLDVLVPDEELKRRKAAWRAPTPRFPRGYVKMYVEHVSQADAGCDFDFLEYTDEDIPEPDIY